MFPFSSSSSSSSSPSDSWVQRLPGPTAQWLENPPAILPLAHHHKIDLSKTINNFTDPVQFVLNHNEIVNVIFARTGWAEFEEEEKKQPDEQGMEKKKYNGDNNNTTTTAGRDMGLLCQAIFNKMASLQAAPFWNISRLCPALKIGGYSRTLNDSRELTIIDCTGRENPDLGFLINHWATHSRLNHNGYRYINLPLLLPIRLDLQAIDNASSVWVGPNIRNQYAEYSISGVAGPHHAEVCVDRHRWFRIDDQGTRDVQARHVTEPIHFVLLQKTHPAD